MNNLTQKLAAIGVGMTLVTAPAMAKHKDRHHYDAPTTYTAKARVVSVKPIEKSISHRRPHEVCEWRPNHRPYRDNHRSDYHGDKVGSAVLGAVIGGVIGHQFGSGRGNDAATIAGAAIGAHVGHERGRHDRHGHRDHHADKHRGRRECRTEYETYQTYETVGYKVKYKYNGEVYRTRTRHNPGKWLTLHVSFRPAE